MTVPVAWERRAPLAAAAAVAVGAVANELLIGPMVRCGPALPAVFAIAFFAGTRLDRRRLAVAVACCLAAVTTQSFFDPSSALASWSPGCRSWRGSALAGQLVRSRGAAAAALRERNAELREQREQTARLAVAADRARVAGGSRRVPAGPDHHDGRRRRSRARAGHQRTRPAAQGALRRRREQRAGHPVADAGGGGHAAGGSGSPRRSRCSPSSAACWSAPPAPTPGCGSRAARGRCPAGVELSATGSWSTCWPPWRTHRRPASTYSCGSAPMRLSWTWPGQRGQHADPVAAFAGRAGAGRAAAAGRCGSRPARPLRRARPAAAAPPTMRALTASADRGRLAR